MTTGTAVLILIGFAGYLCYLIIKAIFNFINQVMQTTAEVSSEVAKSFNSNVIEGGIKPFISSITFSKHADLNPKVDINTFLDYEFKEELIVKVLTMMAMSNNKIDEYESKIIKEFIRSKIGKRDVVTNFYKTRMDQAIIDASSVLQSQNFPIKNISKTFQFNFSVDERYDILELCMRVMSADKKIHKHEISMLHSISKSFGIKVSDDRFVALKDKHFLKGEYDDNSISGIEIKLGIDSSLSKREKNKLVVKLYKKWNSRLNILKNKEDRIKAQNYLDLLGKWKSLNK